jgi:TatD DNase family protein
MAMARWTDDHCHLPDGEAGDQLVAEAREAGVERFVTVGTDVESSRRMVDIARRHGDGVLATAGVHPHDAKRGIDGLEDLLAEPEVVAVGECGLDFYYDNSPRDVQREVFAAQIAMAQAHGLPLVIHSRDAWTDTFDVLEAEGVPERTVFHCFTGGPDEARRSLDLGAHLSFSGIITFGSAQDLRDAAAICPVDRVLVETDSPYLAPEPHRGRKNRPALLPFVGAGLAAAMGRDVEEVATATWENAERFYGF